MNQSVLKIRNNRPTFFYKNDEKMEIRAGGMIYYRFNEELQEPEFLMIKCNGHYEDFGGRTEMGDVSIEETVAREAEEESNNIFVKKEIFDSIKTNNLSAVYTKVSKYIIYFIKTKKNYVPEEFGKKENHDNILRTVKWVPYSKLMDKKFIKDKLHIRLKNKSFFKTIEKIKYDEYYLLDQ